MLLNQQRQGITYVTAYEVVPESPPERPGSTCKEKSATNSKGDCLFNFLLFSDCLISHISFFFLFYCSLCALDLVDTLNARLSDPHRSGVQNFRTLKDHLFPFLSYPTSFKATSKNKQGDTQQHTFPINQHQNTTDNHSTATMGKKQFIDRKNARHFHLVHRSQRDPLSRDESAPQRVLKEVIPANLIGKVAIPQEEFDGDSYSDGEGDIFGEHGTEDGINYGTYDREIEAVELLEAPVAASKKKKGVAKNEE